MHGAPRHPHVLPWRSTLPGPSAWPAQEHLRKFSTECQQILGGTHAEAFHCKGTPMMYRQRQAH
eukprot:scaffold83640_cov17-Prasinocladus_malaysianus.AAC.1